MTKELAAGLMYRPTAIDRDGTDVFVVEQYNHRVSKWNFLPAATPPANFVFTLDATWGSNGDGTTGGPGRTTATDDTNFNFPTGIVVLASENRIFVTDTLNHRIRVINLATGAFVDSIGTPGTGNGELYRPTHIADAQPTGILTVADSRNHRFSTFNDTTFAFLGNATPPAEGFHTPHGIKHNATNVEFYYSDLIRGKLFTYDATDGTTPAAPTTIGTPGTESSVPNELFYPGSASGSTGTAGDSFLTDTRNNTIKEFTAAGVVSDRLTGEGTTEGTFYFPDDTLGFAQTGSDYILVCNTLNNRVEVFNRVDDTFQNTFGSPTPVLP